MSIDYHFLYNKVIKESLILTNQEITMIFLDSQVKFSIYYNDSGNFIRGDFTLKPLYGINVDGYRIFNVLVERDGIIIQTSKMINGIEYFFSIPLMIADRNEQRCIVLSV